jgi:GT2 family glycosyltransferase
MFDAREVRKDHRTVPVTSPPPGLTVAICTHNRFDDLRSVLDALRRQILAPAEMEVLIVDNSTDLAARDAFRAASDLPANARWLDSSPPGLARARNLALREARAPLVAFLDDDAVPLTGWAEALALEARAHPDAAVFAGPIEADWLGQARPAWLPGRHEGALTILDHGPDDRALKPGEHGYGANFALRREPALAAGGFEEQLGRKGASLLSNEETALQDRLREAGHAARYVARARVLHRIRAERLSRDWFRARMAWQAVSASLQEGGWPWQDWSRQELRRAAAALGIEDAMATLLEARDGEAFADQLDVFLHLFLLLLAAAKDQPSGLEELFPKRSAPAEAAPAAAEEVSDAYRPSAAVPVGTDWVFAEYQNSHGYLFDLYGDLPRSALLDLPGEAWAHDPRPALGYLGASLPPRGKALVLLTLDPFSLNPRAAQQLVEASARWKLPLLGIQHRAPEGAEQRRAFETVAAAMHRVLVLSDDLETRLKSAFANLRIASVPHHPTKFQYYVPGQAARARHAMGARPDHVVFGFVGEARQGKGLGLLLAALEHLPAAVREQAFFVLAGRARDIDPDAARTRFEARRIAARIDLRESRQADHYAVLTASEYAEVVSATDYGLLLYQGTQRTVASGVLSDFVWQGRRVIATRDSSVGATVARHELGLTLAEETPEALARLIGDAVAQARSGEALPAAFTAYREAHSPKATLAALQAVLNGVPGWAGHV